ncbi:hypothetical protein [Dactylosporangium cerinum]
MSTVTIDLGVIDDDWDHVDDDLVGLPRGGASPRSWRCCSAWCPRRRHPTARTR